MRISNYIHPSVCDASVKDGVGIHCVDNRWLCDSSTGCHASALLVIRYPLIVRKILITFFRKILLTLLPGYSSKNCYSVVSLILATSLCYTIGVFLLLSLYSEVHVTT